MKVLSLFDGISCGMVALERAGIPVDRYVAYEYDEETANEKKGMPLGAAAFISQKNHPTIEHCGDVTKADFTQYEGFDLLLAGFPCQDLSVNKANRKGLEGKRSGLFWQAVRAIKEAKPKYFLIENNYKMPEADLKTITETLGVEPIMIDSSTVSAQQRKRLYWTNIENVTQPVQRNLNVVDIVESSDFIEDLTSETKFNNKKDICERQTKPLRIGTIGKGGQGERVYSVYGKSVTLKANGGGRGAKTGLYLIDNKVRKLSPLEAERLQMLPDNYTKLDEITTTQRYKTIGNGWTVDVIAHIFKGLV